MIKGFSNKTMSSRALRQAQGKLTVAISVHIEIAADFVLATFGIAGHPAGARDEQRRFTEGKIPLYPPFPKGEDLTSLLCKRRAGEDFKELFIPSITPSQNGVSGSQ